MIPFLLRILFLLLIPAGIYLLIKGIQLLRKMSGGVVLLSIPLTQREAHFTLPKEGQYAIWQKGRKIRKVAIAMPTPVIQHELTGKKISLEYPFATISSNDWRYGKMRVFTFVAPAGQYSYILSDHSYTRDTLVGKLRTHTKTDRGDCFIEIKENRPAWQLVACILLLIFSGFCIIAGIVVSLNYNAIFAR